jgi:hypothetical protein
MDKKIIVNDFRAFTNKFLEEYLSNGMATMSKREIDILMMHLLLEYCNLSNMSNYDLSLMLKLSETRVKSLRYEARLKYPTPENYVEREFLIVLGRAKFELDKSDKTNVEKMKISFVIEDNFLRQAIQGKLKARGMFADTSFNSEIVRVESGFLLSIIDDIYGEARSSEFKEAIKQFSKADQKSLAAKTKDVILPAVINIAVKTLAEAGVAYVRSSLGM